MSSPCFAVSLVTFDVGGTLLTLRPDQASEWSRVLAETGIRVPEERIEAALERERPHAAARRSASVPASHRVTPQAGEERRRTFIRNVLAGAGIEPDDLESGLDAVKAALDSPHMYQPYDDAMSTLQSLSDRGLKLGAIANSWPSMPRVLMAFGFDRYLGFWMISELVGVEKPSPEIFQRALALAGTPADKALHVGDTIETDVVGARAAGVEAVLLDRVGSAETEHAARGLRVPVVHSLSELLQLIP